MTLQRNLILMALVWCFVPLLIGMQQKLLKPIKLKSNKNILKRYFSKNLNPINKKDIAKPRILHNKFSTHKELNKLVENEITLKHKANPKLGINDILPDALKNAKKQLKENIIPQEAQRLSSEYQDQLTTEDYIRTFNKNLNRHLLYGNTDASILGIKTGMYQKNLSKKLNIPIDSPNKRRGTGYFALSLHDKKEKAKARFSYNRFFINEELNKLVENELILKNKANPKLGINDILPDALENAKKQLKENIIPQEAQRLFSEYQDQLTTEDYIHTLNEVLNEYLLYGNTTDGTYKENLSKKLNIPLSSTSNIWQRIKKMFGY